MPISLDPLLGNFFHISFYFSNYFDDFSSIFILPYITNPRLLDSSKKFLAYFAFFYVIVLERYLIYFEM